MSDRVVLGQLCVVLSLLLFVCVAGLDFGESPCNSKTEFPCDSKGCIYRYQWCDSVKDCEDGSDEAYCGGREDCLLHHFRCNDGTCVPLSARCDNFTDCKDSSDENCGTPINILNDFAHDFHHSNSEINSAVINASKWILSLRGKDLSWGDMTPRAIVALSFADKVSKMSDESKSLLRKQLNINLALDLMRNRTMLKLTPSKLSLYINALYATCQDPSNFQGIDLISILRHETDSAIKDGHFSLPITMLTLCLAHRSVEADFRVLLEFYENLQNDKIGSKAIAVMALSCMLSRFTRYHFKEEGKRVLGDFARLFDSVVNNVDIDIYTKALYLQARVSLGDQIDGFSLLQHKQDDGSFGDLLATYYAVPVLVNSSLLNLMKGCQGKTFEKLFLGVPPIEDSRISSKIFYSVWIDGSSGKNTYSMEITFLGNQTLFDIMKSVESKDEAFRFQYDETNDGVKLYSLANIPDDAEKGIFWELFVGRDVAAYSLDGFKEEQRGLDKIFPRNNEHFIFSLKSQ